MLALWNLKTSIQITVFNSNCIEVNIIHVIHYFIFYLINLVPTSKEFWSSYLIPLQDTCFKYYFSLFSVNFYSWLDFSRIISFLFSDNVTRCVVEGCYVEFLSEKCSFFYSLLILILLILSLQKFKNNEEIRII